MPERNLDKLGLRQQGPENSGAQADGGTGKKSGRSIVKTMIRLWNYLRTDRLLIVLIVLLAVLSNCLALLGPLLSGRAIDALGGGTVNFRLVFHYCRWMAFFFAVSSVLNYILSAGMISLSQRAARRMRNDIFDKLMNLPVSFFDTRQTGDLISHISYDIDTVNTSLANDLLQICTTVVTVAGSLAMMLAISPGMGLIFLVTIPPAGFFIRHQSEKIHHYFRLRSIKLGALNGFVEEMVSGLKTIKAYHQEKTTLSRFDEVNEEAVGAYYDADYHSSSLGPSVNFINNLSLTLVSVFGAVLYLLGRISLGSMSSFVLYSRKFSGPINEAANILAEIQSATAAADRVFALMDEKGEAPDRKDAAVLEAVQGRVELSHIRFGYVPGKTVLKDLSLCAEQGSLIAIAGHTGAGKTTIINLLMRFYDPESGTISIDGKEIRGVTRKSLRLAFAMVLQESWLFNGTVYENIAYGKAGASREDVEAAAKTAQAHYFITRLPGGYDTVLSEDGVNISQGQKQLLTIARAMLLDVRMLILDEATSNVDTRTELRIQEAMRRLMKDKTCFVIAHRLSTIQNADAILVMKDGDLAEQGTHQALLEKNGVYAELYRSQFG
ncbi:MAG: ABC transporter ATP-binding protein/permease [Spirochaetaceae bacterium]|jgi:ATP-binding cassette subfamily B protein|nr:ABC transporter ATP-binding protein/permease [Spirochaetaceae bacterium]